MDATFYWSKANNVFLDSEGNQLKSVVKSHVGPWCETLISVINDCVNELQKQTFAKHGRAKRVSVNAYITENMRLFLSESALYDVVDCGEEQHGSTYVGDAMGIRLHRDRLVTDDIVRVVTVFDVFDNAPKKLYGCVRIK